MIRLASKVKFGKVASHSVISHQGVGPHPIPAYSSASWTDAYFTLQKERRKPSIGTTLTLLILLNARGTESALSSSESVQGSGFLYRLKREKKLTLVLRGSVD